MKLNVFIAGQKWIGAEVYKAIKEQGLVNIAGVCAPFTTDERKDRLYFSASRDRVPLIQAGTLNADNFPGNIDLIIAAHSHDFIGERTRLRARLGGIGYHPSLLPLHRGRDAIRWALRMNDRVTGGTVYKLSNKMDGGDILAQQHIVIDPNKCTAESLWRESLAPMGVRLILDAVKQIVETDRVVGERQDESLATWEPSIDRQPAFRPDLILLEYNEVQNVKTTASTN